jgi:hypothetical protein
MGQNACDRRHNRRAVRADGSATRDILIVNLHRLAFELRPDVIDRLTRPGRLGKHCLHSIDSPEQVDRRGTRRRHHLAQAIELRGQPGRSGGFALSHTQRQPHRGGDADRRRAADDHRLDGSGNLL